MNGENRLCQRRWSFDGCVFDEANWTLVVDDRRIPIEAKPLELLRQLLLAEGQLVTKRDLLTRIWPGVHVVDASLTTAIHKLRHAFGANRHIIETVPGLGYRLNVPAASEGFPAKADGVNEDSPHLETVSEDATPSQSRLRSAPIAGGLFIGLAILAAASMPSGEAAANKKSPAYSQRDVEKALRRLDIEAVERMIEDGWNPATVWDKEGNDALGALINQCEWDGAHDRRKMLLMARTLIEGGAPIDRRNVWGDTAYSIAKAPRYCGPDHPVTQMLEAMCYGGSMGPKDLCLATYELTPKQREAQGLPPKGVAASRST